MSTLYSTFMRSIRWNALESAFYHLLLLSHNIALFKIIDSQLYGLSSTIIASLYAIVMIGNFGLDATLGPLFYQYRASKKDFRLIIGRQLLMQLVLFACVGSVLVCFPAKYFFALGTGLSLLVILIIVSEGIKKTARTLLQIAFKNQITTVIEVATISVYMIMVWGWYALVGSISLYSLLTPLLITSVGSNLILFSYIYQWYQTLPEHEASTHTSHQLLYKRIITSRALCTIYSIGQQLFSSNVLIPTLALQAGLQQAGIFTLIATITSTVTSIFNKIGGHTTQAVLAHIKDNDLTTKQTAFAFITSELLHIIFTILIFLCINYQKVILVNRHIVASDEWLAPAYLYLLLVLTDYFILAYEKFYINEEHGELLALFTGVSIAIGMISINYSSTFSPTFLLTALLIIRLANLTTLALVSYWYWGIKPHLKIKPWYLMGVIVTSFLFFVIL